MKKVHDLKSLRERQEMLKLEMKISKNSFQKSINKTKDKTGTFILNFVLIPLGAGGLIKTIFDHFNSDGEQAYKEKPSWLIFAEQIIHNIGEQFSTPFTDDERNAS